MKARRSVRIALLLCFALMYLIGMVCAQEKEAGGTISGYSAFI